MICRYCFTPLFLLLWACQSSPPPVDAPPFPKAVTPRPTVAPPQLDRAEAQRLAALPLACLDTEYPNKLSQVLSILRCFDWHSAVHGVSMALPRPCPSMGICCP